MPSYLFYSLPIKINYKIKNSLDSLLQASIFKASKLKPQEVKKPIETRTHFGKGQHPVTGNDTRRGIFSD